MQQKHNTEGSTVELPDADVQTTPSLLDAVVEVPIAQRVVNETYCAYCEACPPKGSCFLDRWIMTREVKR